MLCQMPPPTANSSFSRITLSGSGRGNSCSRSGVIVWRNSLISVRQSSSVRSRGHSAASGSQQVIGSFPWSFPLCGGLTRQPSTVATFSQPKRCFQKAPFAASASRRGRLLSTAVVPLCLQKVDPCPLFGHSASLRPTHGFSVAQDDPKGRSSPSAAGI